MVPTGLMERVKQCPSYQGYTHFLKTLELDDPGCGSKDCPYHSPDAEARFLKALTPELREEYALEWGWSR